jgi:tRNA (cytidine56-2'-O)-methyltransferase
LTARAFGCNGIILSGEKDEKIMRSIEKVVEKWGGPFEVEYEKNWKKIMEKWRGKKIHLTMYGLPIQEKIEEIRKCEEDLLVIVGSEKVPGEVYELADWNISITNQPHSEVAALALFLDRVFKGKELSKNFKGKKLKIIPQERGKKILKV